MPILHHLDTLLAIMDRIVPPDSDAPGASESEVPVFVLALVQELGLEEAYQYGLDRVDRLANRRGESFRSLAPAQQDEILRAPELAPFVSMLAEHTIEGYYTSPTGLRAVGFRVTA